MDVNDSLLLEDIAKDLEVKQDKYYSGKDRLNKVSVPRIWGSGFTRSL